MILKEVNSNFIYDSLFFTATEGSNASAACVCCYQHVLRVCFDIKCVFQVGGEARNKLTVICKAYMSMMVPAHASDAFVFDCEGQIHSLRLPGLSAPELTMQTVCDG